MQFILGIACVLLARRQGVIIGAVLGFIGSTLFEEWLRVVLFTFTGALIGLLVTHFGKKLLKKWKL